MSVGTLFGTAMATCTQRVFLVAYEVGAPITFTHVDLFTGEQKKEAHLLRQPFGQIPAFESSAGVKLFESRAIARYIDAKAGGKLAQRDNLDKNALVETWISVEGANFEKYASPIVIELFYKSMRGMKPDEDELTKLKGLLNPVLDVYNKELSSRSFLTGDEYTIADLFHLPTGHLLFKILPELLEGRPNLKRWFDSLSSLPSWQKTLQLTQN